MLTDSYPVNAAEALAKRDWYSAYRWAKGWISSGGGAWTLDPWLVYAASALMQRQPRQAIHSLDLALKTWIDAPPDRAILLWARGEILLRWLDDPKTALLDLREAANDAPAWLRADAVASLTASERDAPKSRKPKPSVELRPAYMGDHIDRGVVAPPPGPRSVGGRPVFLGSLLDELRRASDIHQR